jgi:hypothetical protein
MMHLHSPSSRFLAVPGIGFPPNIAMGPDMFDPEVFRDRPLTERRKPDDAHHDQPADGIASLPWFCARW